MDPLEEVEFLARSENRVELLGLLAAGRHDRAELADRTDVSQATLGRILEDFGERSWVRHEGDGYVATATGRLVAEGIGELLETLSAEQSLREVVRYLPTHAMEFDLRRLADAEVTEPTRTRPSAPLQSVLELMGSATDLRAFSHTFNERSLATVHERVTDGEQTFSGVFPRQAYVSLAADDDSWERILDLVDAPDARLCVREEGIPLAVTLSVARVNMLVRDEAGLLQATVETTDEAVLSWARENFDHYRRTAATVDAETAATLRAERS